MLRLIPSVKVLTEKEGFLKKNTLKMPSSLLDSRLASLIAKLPCSEDGAEVSVTRKGNEGEGYTLDITADAVLICADGAAGAFYALQTLRQIFANGDPIPCLHIEDKPDFAYRGFYHDVTRGKIPTVQTLKELIDNMAYYKLNSLQLYVEHVFEFEETKDIQPKTGYLTGAELEELDAYCKENFIEFIPSLATFGHMYDILEQPQYRHLRVLEGYEPSRNFWFERMQHHTIDPLQEESLDLVQSLISRYSKHFTSDFFNICGDETFDLKNHPKADGNSGQLYIDFIGKIIEHVKSKGKKVMMWADILLKHPEIIDQLPEDTIFLNWYYHENPPEANTKKFADVGRPQIVCPGTTSWSRLCENVGVAEKNICNFAEQGAKYGAIGVLNTNWGDWGNPCSLELGLYGMVLGAEKSWTVATAADEEFHKAADLLLYGHEGAFDILAKISAAHDNVKWNPFVKAYYAYRYGDPIEVNATEAGCLSTVEACDALLPLLQEPWEKDEFRKELLLTVQGVRILAEQSAKMQKYTLASTSDVKAWIAEYAAQWRKKNKESELRNIVDLFTYLAENE